MLVAGPLVNGPTSICFLSLAVYRGKFTFSASYPRTQVNLTVRRTIKNTTNNLFLAHHAKILSFAACAGCVIMSVPPIMIGAIVLGSLFAIPFD